MYKSLVRTSRSSRPSTTSSWMASAVDSSLVLNKLANHIRLSRALSSTLQFASSPKEETSVRLEEVESVVDERKNGKKNGFQKFKIEKLKRDFVQPYKNHAPTLFNWSQQVIAGSLQTSTLIESPEFKSVSHDVCDTIRHSDKNILNLVKSTIVMGLDPDLEIVRFLETELMFKMDNYDYKLLSETFVLYNPIRDSHARREEIVELIKAKINERLDREKPNLLDLLQLIRLSHLLSPQTYIKIEEQINRLLDLDESHVPLDNLCYLIVLLSRHNRRNKPLIRTVVNKLLKYRSDQIYSTPPHLIHMISSLNRLNYPEVNLLEKCSDILIESNFLETSSESAKRDFIVAISQLNFSYPKLFDYYVQTLIDKPQLFKHQDLVTLVITLSRLHYENDELKEVIAGHIQPRCTDPSLFTSKSQYFNFVYALALLKSATRDQIKSVLSADFLKEMEKQEMDAYLAKVKQQQTESVEDDQADSSDADQASTVPSDSLSIQNIYQIMNLRRKYLTFSGLVLASLRDGGNTIGLEGLTGNSLFDGDEAKLVEFQKFISCLEYQPMKKSKDLTAFKEAIFKSLESFAPAGKLMQINVKTPYGFFIDGQMIVDSNANPQPISSSLDFPTVEQETPLEDGKKKVALMCIGFNDTLLDDGSTLIGPKEAEMRILRSFGYVVVCIHQNSIPNYSSTTNLNRVKFLQNLIVSHLKD